VPSKPSTSMHVAVTLRCCHLIYQFGALVRAGALQLCIVEPRNGLHERLSLAAANDSSLERGRTRIGAGSRHDGPTTCGGWSDSGPTAATVAAATLLHGARSRVRA